MTTGYAGKAMTYDGEKRLLSVTWSGTRTEYVYAADGTRLKLIDDVGQSGEAETLYAGPLEIRDWGATSPEVVVHLGPVRLVDGTESTLHRDALGAWSSSSRSPASTRAASLQYHP